jgi:trigger factor
MHVTETKSEGLSREYKVLVPASELAERLTAKIEEVRPRVQIKGFRPGKVPPSHIKKVYGRSLMGEVVDEAVKETSSKALEDNSLRPASQPSIRLESSAEKIVSGEADLEYHMALEVMPDFEPADVTALKVSRMIAEPEESEIVDGLKRLAEQNQRYTAREAGAAAAASDAVVIDFVGRIDGEAFEGGAAEGHTLVLGSNRFIPGFEDQLVGAKADETVMVKVTFPDDYQVETLKGKPAEFEVKVKEVRAPETPDIDDEFAKAMGLTTLEELRGAVRRQIEFELASASRQQVKRSLLDALDERHAFDLPPLMVNAEFDQIWAQLQGEKEAGRLSEEDAAKSEDDLKAEYRKIAERRVRLGLVLAEIGRRAEIGITNEELAAALRREASRYPGQEQLVINFYRERPEALAQLRAPIFEEKVVDYILAKAQVTEQKVTREELMKEVGEDE